MDPAADVWKISADERAKHDQQFFTLKPMNGFITGEQARGYFLQSGLPSNVLAQIWNLADINKDGKMDKKEFSIAVHLIQKKLQGYTLPSVLTDSLKSDPLPAVGFGQSPPLMISAQLTGSNPSWSPAVAPSPAPCGVSPGLYGAPPLPSGFGGVGASPITVRSKVDWSMPPHSKLKHSQNFNNFDKNRTGFLTGVHARNIFSQCGLPNNILAQIWTYSDLDKDGKLSCDEYCLAMHLIEMVKSGETLPPTLPPEATAFMRQRNPSLGSLGNIQNTMLTGSVDNVSLADEAAKRFAISFEDRRKENFDRGQAELDRRRQIILDQEKRERDERERKDREEFEKRERERMEIERRRQLEIEKQMAKQREEQQKREEEYQKVIEQREAARRELEKQRQVELERQRLHELMLLRQHEQETVCHLKQKEKNLNFQLQALNEKSNDLNNMITEVREKIVGITSSIEGMKRERDSKLLDIETSKRQMQELQMHSSHLMHEKLSLNDRRVNAVGGNADAINDSYRQVMHTYRNKSMNLESLRQSLADVERDLEARNMTSTERHQRLDELNTRVREELAENEELSRKISSSRDAVIKLAPHKAAHLPNSSRPPSFDSAVTHEQVYSDGWASTNGGGNTVKYRAVYEFFARNEDELSFQPGDIILVFKDHIGEPGWLAGQIKDKVGWFPEAFAEPYDAVSSNNRAPDAESPSQQLALPKLESINEESFDKDDDHSTHRFSTGAQPAVAAVRSAFDDTKHQKNGTLSEHKKAVAQFQWKAKKDNHLSFNKGDVITVLEMQEMWWMGELDGKSGWFPKSYVRLASDIERRKSETHSATSSAKPSSSRSQEFPSQAPLSTIAAGTTGRWYLACYSFPEIEPGDLQFEAGDRILVIQDEGEWWTGRCNGREGMFPANYVQAIEGEESTAYVQEKSPSQSDIPEYSAIKKHSTEGSKPPSIEVTTPNETEEYEIGKVIAPYKAVESNQLMLDTGDLIKIRSKSPTGWWEGELQKKGQDKKIGWFPGNYVKIIGKGKRGVGSFDESAATAVASGSESSVPTAENAHDAKDINGQRETVMAMFDYVALQEDELSLNRGDIVTVLEKIDTDWWKGEMANGQQGLFPATYVQPYTGVDRYAKAMQEKQKTDEHDELPPSTTVIDGATGDAPSTPTSSNATDSVKSNNKHSMYCQELMHTEQNYYDDLVMVKEVFYKQMAASKVLNSDELRTIFINWDELIKVTKTFGKLLRQYGEGSVGRAVLDSLKNLRAFVTFCQFQQSSLEFLESKSKSSPQFQAVHASCSQHLAARGLPLSHFLLIPMTRVTKYPLVLKEICKHTPTEHPDYENLHNAMTALKDLCDEVNRVATETDNLQMLYWCQNHIKCESIQPKFVFQSPTNFLGPRKFLHFGVLFKAKSNRLLIGLLFNDVLMLTTPDEAIDHPDSFKLTRTSELVLSLYKQPVLLHKASLQMPPSLTGVESGDDTLFALNNGEILISFKAVSSNGRLLWTKQLEKAIKNARMEYASFNQAQSTTGQPKTATGRLLIEIVFLRNLSIPNDCKSLPIVVELMFSDQKATKAVDLNRTSSDAPSLCTTQFVIDSKLGVFSMAVYVERLYAPNLCLGRAELPLSDMMKMSGLQKNPAMKQLPLICDNADATDEFNNQQVIVKFVVQMFDNQ